MVALCFVAGSARQICLGLGFAALHELGHLAAMLACRTRPQRLCLTAAGMRIERPPDIALRFAHVVAIALAGPAVSLLLAGLFALLKNPDCMYLNLGFALLNLLPLRQLDGGRALYFLLCRRLEEHTASQVLLWLSLGILFFAALGAALVCLRHGLSLSLVVAVIYLAVCC
jgi:stage IV sporulation protein FB